MDNTPPIILNVATPEFGRVRVACSDGLTYDADLSSFSRVYCYPTNFEQWKKVSIDSYGLGLIWSSRFEVHVDQIIGSAIPSPEPGSMASGS